MSFISCVAKVATQNRIEASSDTGKQAYARDKNFLRTFCLNKSLQKEIFVIVLQKIAHNLVKFFVAIFVRKNCVSLT